MNEEIEELIRGLKEKNPDLSEKEIKEYVRNEMYRITISKTKSERRQEDKSKTEIINDCTTIWEDLSDSGMRDDANSIAKNIQEYRDASNAKQDALMRLNSNLTEQMMRKETAEEGRSRTTRKLEELEEDANE